MMQSEYRPLLSETSLDSTQKREGSRKSLCLAGIAILAIFGLFVAFNDGKIIHKRKHYGGSKARYVTKFAGGLEDYSEKDMEFDRLNQFDFSVDKSLPVSSMGKSVDLEGDNWGELSLNEFSSMTLQGELAFDADQSVLSFMIDGRTKQVSFQRQDINTHEVLNSFLTTKSDDLLIEDHYEIDGFTIDPTDEQTTHKGFMSFFESDLPKQIIALSLQLASKGYTGNMAKTPRMLHAFAVHMIEMPTVSDRMEKEFELNRAKLNELFTKMDKTSSSSSSGSDLFIGENEDKRVVEEIDPESQQPVSRLNGGIDGDWCILFWCTSSSCPGDTGDGCPSTCYQMGACEEEDKCDNECFGGCGDDCNCWSWVCGDCTCHCLCQNHDYFCSCVSMLEYQCWAMWSWLDDDCD